MGWILGISVDQEAEDQKIAACDSFYRGEDFIADEKKGLA